MALLMILGVHAGRVVRARQPEFDGSNWSLKIPGGITGYMEVGDALSWLRR